MINFLDRRAFLMETAAGCLALTAGVAVAPAEQPAAEGQKGTAMIPILDTHQHLWDLSRFRLPWLTGAGKLNRSFLMRDYLAATAGLNVVKALYMEVDLAPEQQTDEAEFIIDVCRRREGPTVAAVISGRPASDGFKPYITRFKDSPYIKGVRQVLHNEAIPAGYCLGEKFVRGIRLLGELGKSFDLCLRPGELLDGAKLIDQCRDTRFILDHCGNADVQARDRSPWQRGIAAVAQRKNVVCKVSGIVVSARSGAWTADDLAPFVNHTLDVFGLDRVMFGGDWPVCTQKATFKQWVEALKAIVRDRSELEQRKLFHDNGMRYYGLG